MIFSEKITELRKRSGLSQEQFGEKIGVSRQAVSKWEMAQSVPDINKVMAIADLFGVSVDFLLKDEYGLEDLGRFPVQEVSADAQQKMISLEEVQDYFAQKKKAARLFITAVFLIFISPLPGISLTLKGDRRMVILGAVIQVLFLAAAAVIVLSALRLTSRFRYFNEEERELAYGVKGAAESYQKEFETTRFLGIVLGAALIIASVIPMMICAVFTDTNDLAILLSGAVTLMLFAGGVSSILYVSVINAGYAGIKGHK